ncbi:MAG TPA: S-layer homology domain-containing protein, partial [Candidatus Aveggerthella excrementigallinarum]|nr:S-layer homology domain-containing protein [Candidatus Aveggerthella excrementigallinarum]
AGDVTVHAAFECDGGELCPSHDFTDVDQSQWYHAAIDWAVDNDVLQGVGDGLMLPDGDITRAQMAQVLWNVEGQPAAAEGEGFSDVSEGDWFAGAVAWASQEGIFVGYDGAFDPDAELTREQAATVLMRWAESNGEDVSGRADLSGFPDADGISEWAVESVRWAVDAGVLEGVANPDGTTTVSAQGTATRAQTAALMMRLLEA